MSGQQGLDPSVLSSQVPVQPSTASPAGGQQVTQANFEPVAPMAEMSAFIQELEAASHIDPATRRQIMATAMQTSPDQQSQMIRHYRAMLALGREATEASSAATVPAVVPDPVEPAALPKPETGVAATHGEVIEGDRSTSLPEVESSSDVERQLVEAILREVKKSKVEPAVHTARSEHSDDRSDRERKKGDDRPRSDGTWEETRRFGDRETRGAERAAPRFRCS